MLYAGYNFDIEQNQIRFDSELRMTKLPFKVGDYFQVVEQSDGTVSLVKVTSVEEFLLKGVKHD